MTYTQLTMNPIAPKICLHFFGPTYQSISFIILLDLAYWLIFTAGICGSIVKLSVYGVQNKEEVPYCQRLFIFDKVRLALTKIKRIKKEK